MAYAQALRSIPSLPSPQGAFTDAQGRPTRELYTFLADLIAWTERVQAALTELEPP
jgi:hypothetical protein